MSTTTFFSPWHVAVAAGLGLLLAGCGTSQNEVPTASIVSSERSNVGAAAGARPGDAEPVKLVRSGQFPGQEFQSPAQSQQEFFPEVVIQTNLGTMRVRLNGDKSPRTVINFLENYVDAGFYDGTIFHYVESGYMVAGGGYTANLEQKDTQPPIPCEANNGLLNRRGTIAMARHPDFVHSGTSQFYINLVDNPSLDYQPNEGDLINGYCVFGEVIEGMDVVDKIAQVPVHHRESFMNVPTQPVMVESIQRVK